MNNKNKKANDANWFAILQAFQGTPQGNAVAVASTLQSDIARDGADQGDIHRNAANTIFAQANNPVAFMQNMLSEHPDMMDELDSYLDEKHIQVNNIQDLIPIIESYLKEKRKYGNGGQFDENPEFVDVEINGKVYHLLNCVTEEEKERGLSNVIEMSDSEGALFDYSDEPQAELSFWMHDTSLELLICFINESGVVISVHNGVPNTDDPITESSEFIAYVIEVSAGENIKPGDETSLGKTIEETDPDEDENTEDEYPDLPVNHLIIYGSDGKPQGFLSGNERIFSRKSTRVIIRKAKRAYKSQSDTDFKALGRYVFNEMKNQDERKPEYTS